MAIRLKSWRLSSILLALAGITLVGAGLYFLLLRPPLLSEDVRYMGLSAAQLAAVRLRLEAWLTHVFRVMGGYVLATGVLTIALAATSFRTRHWGAGLGALVGGAVSIGWMAVVNFMIDSDFKWTRWLWRCCGSLLVREEPSAPFLNCQTPQEVLIGDNN